MRLVVQKVGQASVTSAVADQPAVTSTIGKGLLVLVGFEKGDTAEDTEATSRTLLKLRLFPSTDQPQPRPNFRTLGDFGGDLMLVSQFTLSTQLKSGRPSFHRAMDASQAKQMFSQFVRKCREQLPEGCAVECGVFGAMMNVHLVNEGPFTVCLTCRDGKCDTW